MKKQVVSRAEDYLNSMTMPNTRCCNCKELGRVSKLDGLGIDCKCRKGEFKIKKNIKPNWYKEKRTTKERRCIYGFLRLNGYTIQEAIRIRDWSMPHILLNLNSKSNLKNKHTY